MSEDTHPYTANMPVPEITSRKATELEKAFLAGIDCPKETLCGTRMYLIMDALYKVNTLESMSLANLVSRLNEYFFDSHNKQLDKLFECRISLLKAQTEANILDGQLQHLNERLTASEFVENVKVVNIAELKQAQEAKEKEVEREYSFSEALNLFPIGTEFRLMTNGRFRRIVKGEQNV